MSINKQERHPNTKIKKGVGADKEEYSHFSNERKMLLQ